MRCASEESMRIGSGYFQNEIIDNELFKYKQVRLPVPADGHCVIRAFYKSFVIEGPTEISSYTELLQDACTEIMENLSFYGDKIPAKTDIVQELYNYRVKKVYNQDIVDLVLYALANCTNSTIVIVYVHEGCVKWFEVLPARKGIVSQRSVTLARIGEHYESVVTQKTSKSSDIPVIVISDNDSTPKKTNLIGDNAVSTSFVKIHDQDRIIDSEFEPSRKKLKAKKNLFEEEEGSSSSALYNSLSDSDVDHTVSSSIPSKLTPEVWSEIPVLKRDTLPNDIDGNVVYELPFDHKNRMASSKDGRRWRRYMSSTRSGFTGIRHLARCSGSYKCTKTL